MNCRNSGCSSLVLLALDSLQLAVLPTLISKPIYQEWTLDIPLPVYLANSHLLRSCRGSMALGRIRRKQSYDDQARFFAGDCVIIYATNGAGPQRVSGGSL